jgi:hypothetical protein
MRIVCWITRAKNTHSEYVILTAFPLQWWLQECTSLLHSTYSTVPVLFDLNLCWLFVVSGFRHVYCHSAKVIYCWTMEQRKQPVPQEIALASDIFDKLFSSSTLKGILGHHRQLCELLHIKPTFFPHFYPKLKVRFLSRHSVISLSRNRICAWRQCVVSVLVVDWNYRQESELSRVILSCRKYRREEGGVSVSLAGASSKGLKISLITINGPECIKYVLLIPESSGQDCNCYLWPQKKCWCVADRAS